MRTPCQRCGLLTLWAAMCGACGRTRCASLLCHARRGWPVGDTVTRVPGLAPARPPARLSAGPHSIEAGKGHFQSIAALCNPLQPSATTLMKRAPRGRARRARRRRCRPARSPQARRRRAARRRCWCAGAWPARRTRATSCCSRAWPSNWPRCARCAPPCPGCLSPPDGSPACMAARAARPCQHIRCKSAVHLRGVQKTAAVARARASPTDASGCSDALRMLKANSS